MKIQAARVLKAVPRPSKSSCVWTKVDTCLAVLLALLIATSAVLALVYVGKHHRGGHHRHHGNKEPKFEAQRMPDDGYLQAMCKIDDVSFNDGNIPCGQTDEGEWCDGNILRPGHTSPPLEPIQDEDNLPDWMNSLIDQGRDMMEDHGDNLPDWMNNLHEQLADNGDEWIEQMRDQGGDLLNQFISHLGDQADDARNWMSQMEEQNGELMEQLMQNPEWMDRIIDTNPALMEIMLESNIDMLQNLCEQAPHILERTLMEHRGWAMEFLEHLRQSNPELLETLEEMIPSLVAMLPFDEKNHLPLFDAVGDEDFESVIKVVLEKMGGQEAVDWFLNLKDTHPEWCKEMIDIGGDWMDMVIDNGAAGFDTSLEIIKQEAPEWLRKLAEEHEDWLRVMAEKGADIKATTAGWDDYYPEVYEYEYEDVMNAEIMMQLQDIFQQIGGQQAVDWIANIQEEKPEWLQDIIEDGQKWMDKIIDNGATGVDDSLTSIRTEGPDWIQTMAAEHEDWVHYIAENGDDIRGMQQGRYRRQAPRTPFRDHSREHSGGRGPGGRGHRGHRWGHSDSSSSDDVMPDMDHGDSSSNDEAMPSMEHPDGFPFDSMRPNRDHIDRPGNMGQPLPDWDSFAEQPDSDHLGRPLDNSRPHRPDMHRPMRPPPHLNNGRRPLPPPPPPPMPNRANTDNESPIPEFEHMSPCMSVSVTWTDEHGNEHRGNVMLHNNVTEAELFPGCSFVECNAGDIDENRKEIDRQMNEMRNMMNVDGQIPCFVHPSKPQAALYQEPSPSHHKKKSCMKHSWFWPALAAAIMLLVLLIRRCYFGCCKKTSDVQLKVMPEKAENYAYVETHEVVEDEKKMAMDEPYVAVYPTTDMSPTNVYVPQSLYAADAPPAYHSLDVAGLMATSLDENVAPLETDIDPLKKYMLLQQEAMYEPDEKKISLA